MTWRVILLSKLSLPPIRYDTFNTAIFEVSAWYIRGVDVDPSLTFSAKNLQTRSRRSADISGGTKGYQPNRIIDVFRALEHLNWSMER